MQQVWSRKDRREGYLIESLVVAVDDVVCLGIDVDA